MNGKRKPWLFRFYQGPDYASDGPWMAALSFGGRPDLMRHPQEAGRMIPVAAELTIKAGRSRTAIEDGLPWPVGFRLYVYFRSEVGEIARRLAGFPDSYPNDNRREIPLIE